MNSRSASLIIWAGISVTTLVLSWELGLSKSTESWAEGERPLLNGVFQERMKAIEKQEREIQSKELVLVEKEKILREQVLRYEAEVRRYQQLNSELEKRVVDQIDKQHQAVIADQSRLDQEKMHQERLDEVLNQKKEQEAQQNQRVENLRGLYEKMDAKRAGKILDEMELALAVEIVRAMKAGKAAEILAKMTSEKARKISERIGSLAKNATQDGD